MKTLKPTFNYSVYAVIAALLLTACSSDDSNNSNTTNTGSTTTAGAVSDAYILAVDAFDQPYLINHDGEVLFQWDLSNENLGNDAQLLDDGSLLVALKVNNPQINFGGYGGKFRKINADQSIEWEVSYNSSDYIAHHDVEELSNGNIIFPVWEKVNSSDATALGFAESNTIYPDAIIEMNPYMGTVVWEWHMTDHLVQDYDSNQANYGVIAESPNRIDINYNSTQSDGDLSHVNGITIDETNDLVYITVNYYSEVWVIDHSTTTEEATGSTGGTYGLGGDLVYRFGNPLAYDNVGDVTLNRVHYPNLFDDNKMLVFANNIYNGQSAVVEYQLAPPFQLIAGEDNEPAVTWEFTDSSLFSLNIGGAVRMANGNTLITEGTGTLWEVTDAGAVVWQNTDFTSPWRAYAYELDAPALSALGL